MTRQYSTAVRDDWLDSYEASVGTAPKLRVLTGAKPAACATAESGTLLCELTLPSNWMADAASGSKALAGSWAGTVVADGTAGYYRVVDTAGTTCHEQGTITRSFALATSALTTAGDNVLTFADTTGVTAGMAISGVGVQSGATVFAVDATTVTMSEISTAGVASAASITFGDTSGDLTLSVTAMTTGMSVAISTWTLTAPGA